MGVAVDAALLQRDALGEKQVVHGDKGVARLVELVHHLKGGVYALGKMSCIKMMGEPAWAGRASPTKP